MSKKDTIENKIIFWVSVAFILWCLVTAVKVAAEADPCRFERNNAVSVCRAMGRKSPECADAVADYKMCKAESAGNDPLEGLL